MNESEVHPLVLWDEEIERMTLALRSLRTALETSSRESELHQDNQAEADSVGYRWRAYREAKPVLVRLYGEYEAARKEERHLRRALDEDVATFTRVALWTGIVGTILILGGLGMQLWWWVPVLGVLLWGGCALATVAASGARRSAPDSAPVMTLAARIDGIERACEECWTLEGLDSVRRLMKDPAPGPVTELVRQMH